MNKLYVVITQSIYRMIMMIFIRKSWF